MVPAVPRLLLLGRLPREFYIPAKLHLIGSMVREAPPANRSTQPKLLKSSSLASGPYIEVDEVLHLPSTMVNDRFVNLPTKIYLYNGSILIISSQRPSPRAT